MKALQLAKKYRCRLNYVYQVLYDLEAKGFQTTYEELKREVRYPLFEGVPQPRFQTTYEELKLLFYSSDSPTIAYASRLPMRN